MQKRHHIWRSIEKIYKALKSKAENSEDLLKSKAVE